MYVGYSTVLVARLTLQNSPFFPSKMCKIIRIVTEYRPLSDLHSCVAYVGYVITSHSIAIDKVKVS